MYIFVDKRQRAMYNLFIKNEKERLFMKKNVNIRSISALLSLVMVLCAFVSCGKKQEEEEWSDGFGPSWGAMVDEEFLPDEFKDEVKDDPEWTVTERGSITCNEISGDYSYSNAIIYRSGAFCGIVDNNGNVRVKPQYDNISMLSKDYAVVEKNGLYGLITADGEELVPCEYEEVRKVNGSDKFVVFDGIKLYSIEDKEMYRFISSVTDSIIYNFENHIQVWSRGEYENYLTIYDEKGTFLATDYIDDELDEFDLRRGYISVLRREGGIDAYYSEKLIDFDGSVLLDFETKEVFDKEGNFLFKNQESGRKLTDYYNIKDKIFVEYEIFDKTSEKTLYGILDQNGNEIISETDMNIARCGNCFSVGRYSESYALFDCEENQITDFIYDLIFTPLTKKNVDFIIAEQSGYEGIFSLDGEKLTECIYDDIEYQYTGDYLPVCMNGLWGLVDRNGVLVCPTQFEGELEQGSVISFEDDTGPYVVNPKTGEMRRYGYIENDEDVFPEGIFWFSTSKTEGGIATYEKDLITFTGGANSSTDITEDGKVIIIGSGNTYTFYELKKEG